MILFTSNFYVSVTALIMGQFSQAIVDVICDGYMAEKARIDPINGANELQRYSWGSLGVACILGIIIGGQAADHVDPKYLLSSLAFCPFLVILASFSIEEKKSHHQFSFARTCHSFCKHLRALWNTVITKEIILLIIFIILWNVTLLSFSSIFIYYLYDVLFVSPSTISYFQLSSYIGLCIGILISSRKLIQMSLFDKFIFGRTSISLLTILDIIILKKYYESIGISYHFFLFGSATVGQILDMAFSRMPFLIIFAKISPLHIESTFYSLMSSIFNFGNFLSGLLTGLIMNITKIEDSKSPDAWILSVISMGVGILSLLLLFIFPKRLTKLDDEKEPNNLTESMIELNSKST